MGRVRMFKLLDKVTGETVQIYDVKKAYETRVGELRIEFLIYAYELEKFCWVDSSYYEPLDAEQGERAQRQYRRIDEIGRVVFPRTFRDALNVDEAGDLLQLDLVDNQVVVSKCEASSEET